MAEKFDYTHGDQGEAPTNPLNFQSGEPIPPEKFDWFWYNVIQSINGHANSLEAIDSDGDGDVDRADSAAVADSANNVDGSDVSGQVDSAATADEAKSMEVRTNDPTNPDPGQMWIRSDL